MIGVSDTTELLHAFSEFRALPRIAREIHEGWSERAWLHASAAVRANYEGLRYAGFYCRDNIPETNRDRIQTALKGLKQTREKQAISVDVYPASGFRERDPLGCWGRRNMDLIHIGGLGENEIWQVVGYAVCVYWHQEYVKNAMDRICTDVETTIEDK